MEIDGEVSSLGAFFRPEMGFIIKSIFFVSMVALTSLLSDYLPIYYITEMKFDKSANRRDVDFRKVYGSFTNAES